MRVTYDVRGGALVPSEEQPWPTSTAPFETEYGVMPPEGVFYRGGVDVFVFGSAHAPGGRKTSELNVSVEIGDGFRRDARIFGPRVWYRRISGLVPGPPQPFTSIPLTLAHAYGGKEPWDGTEVPFSDNPDGTGFYTTEERAEGRPLPCIEDPAQLIKKWDDRPAPVGFGFVPPYASARMREVMRAGQDGKISLDMPAFFNAAFPGMVARRVEPGAPVRLSGVHPSGPFTFELPNTLPVARLRLGPSTAERPMAIDQIGVEVERRRAFVSYRYPFRYVVRPLERRIFEISLE
nr:DUF2169 domain-containing protein [Polyangium spumosum]